MFEKQPSYTPTEAKRAYEQLDQLVAKKAINPRQAGAYRRHIASRVQAQLHGTSGTTDQSRDREVD
jgi:hypothetical protein